MRYSFTALEQIDAILAPFIQLKSSDYIKEWMKESFQAHDKKDGFFPIENTRLREEYGLRDKAEGAVVVGVDIPVLLQGKSVNSNGVVAIVAQDPLRNPKDYGKDSIKQECKIYVGTPFGVHSSFHLGANTHYTIMIEILLRHGLDVYLTDIFKIYFGDVAKETQRIVRRSRKAYEESCKDILRQELELVSPKLIATLGRSARLAVTDMYCEEMVKTFPHISGAARGFWKDKLNKGELTAENMGMYVAVEILKRLQIPVDEKIVGAVRKQLKK